MRLRTVDEIEARYKLAERLSLRALKALQAMPNMSPYANSRARADAAICALLGQRPKE